MTNLEKAHRLPTVKHPTGMLKVAVVGGNGFIGRHFVSKLGKSYKNLDIYSLDLNRYGTFTDTTGFISTLNQITMDVSAPGNVYTWMLAHKPDVVVFMAGSEGPAGGLSPLTTTTTDLQAVVALNRTLDAINQIPTDYFLYVSSSAVYGNHGKREVIETSKLKPINHVGQTKVLAEQMVTQFCESAGQRFGIVRPTEVYGRHNWIELLDSNKWPGYVAFYVDRVIRHIQNESIDPMTVLFSPNSLVDVIHVDNVVDILEQLCVQREEGVHNISSGNIYKLQEIISTTIESIQEHPKLPYPEYKERALISFNKEVRTKISHNLVAPSSRCLELVPYEDNKYPILRAFLDDYIPIRMVEIKEHTDYLKALDRTNILDTTGVYNKGSNYDLQKKD